MVRKRRRAGAFADHWPRLCRRGWVAFPDDASMERGKGSKGPRATRPRPLPLFHVVQPCSTPPCLRPLPGANGVSQTRPAARPPAPARPPRASDDPSATPAPADPRLFFPVCFLCRGRLRMPVFPVQLIVVLLAEPDDRHWLVVVRMVPVQTVGGTTTPTRQTLRPSGRSPCPVPLLLTGAASCQQEHKLAVLFHLPAGVARLHGGPRRWSAASGPQPSSGVKVKQQRTNCDRGRASSSDGPSPSLQLAVYSFSGTIYRVRKGR